MGLFLSLAAVVGKSPAAVLECLAVYSTERKGQFHRVDAPHQDVLLGSISSLESNTSILFPAAFLDWDDCGQFLSKQLNTSVFAFHIHDEDMWMFRLFQTGQETARFNPIPDYWGELSKSERSSWFPDPKVVAAAVPGAKAEILSKYLIEWNPDCDDPGPVVPGDQFSTEDCWQMCDFLRQIGFAYPLDEGVDRSCFQLTVPVPELKRKNPKPWWKFW